MPSRKNFPNRAEVRKTNAMARKVAQDLIAQLPVKDQVARLDKLFGVGIGATRQRLRLAKLGGQLCFPDEINATLKGEAR